MSLPSAQLRWAAALEGSRVYHLLPAEASGTAECGVRMAAVVMKRTTREWLPPRWARVCPDCDRLLSFR